MNLEKLLKENLSSEIKTSFSLVDKSTLRTGGEAQYFTQIKDENVEELFSLIGKEGFPYYFLGRGSNSLFPDTPIPGLVIQAASNQKKYRIKNETLILDGSIYLPQAIKIAHSENLIGLEFTAGIPGTIGASVRMNAGTKNGELSSVLEWLKVANRNGINVVPASETTFAYRQSDLPNDWFVLEVGLKLKRGNEKEVEEARESLRGYLNYRNKTQPLSQPTLGSTFVNPPGEYAARLIEECGLKGMSDGGMSISTLHANFLVNDGLGKAANVISLVDRTRECVERESKIWLQTEIIALGFDPDNPCGERI